MYSPENIIWIKNVKRDGGNSWAYDNVTCGRTFLLHWPTSKKGSAGTPHIGDIIILFQKPNTINGRKNYKVHFTHLVSPVSDDIIPDDRRVKHKWCREVQLIAKATPIESIANPGYFNFFLPNRGLTNPIVNLVNNIGLSESETQYAVWDLFKNHFCQEVLNNIYDSKTQIGFFGEIEGDKIMRDHIKQELIRRNSKIIQLAKTTAFKKGNGKILCECCDFDFNTYYGTHGIGFIECHHKIHLSVGQRITTITDLALVCSNCHRMLHRKKTDGSYFSTEELRTMVISQRSKRSALY